MMWFQDAVNRNNYSAFGLIKLSSLEIDTLLPAPGGYTSWDSCITLLGFAAWKKRGGILAALIRAGADPSIRAGQSYIHGAKKFIFDLPRAYAAWVLEELVEMRIRVR